MTASTTKRSLRRAGPAVLGPSDAEAYIHLALVLAYAGLPDEAVQQAEQPCA